MQSEIIGSDMKKTLRFTVLISFFTVLLSLAWVNHADAQAVICESNPAMKLNETELFFYTPKGGGARYEECGKNLCFCVNNLGKFIADTCNHTTDIVKCPPATQKPFKINDLQDPLGMTGKDKSGLANVRAVAATVIKIITGISGSVALLMFVWGGFLWISSAGSAEKAKKAKQVFANAVLGLVIIFGAYAILSTILKAFAGLA